jgi:hypothetical protein
LDFILDFGFLKMQEISSSMEQIPISEESCFELEYHRVQKLPPPGLNSEQDELSHEV